MLSASSMMPSCKNDTCSTPEGLSPKLALPSQRRFSPLDDWRKMHATAQHHCAKTPLVSYHGFARTISELTLPGCLSEPLQWESSSESGRYLQHEGRCREKHRGRQPCVHRCCVRRANPFMGSRCAGGVELRVPRTSKG